MKKNWIAQYKEILHKTAQLHRIPQRNVENASAFYELLMLFISPERNSFR
ncbi:hypothetical protein T11_9645 [Trichinella zimbabwensis]|uniref:Uncharacterized protein n=1 Tax=Trichinella zimbabwensis TaxID=268475 RepID=A0A0V1GA50_9BILA|nr:hypothetical protein T11_9645 [Trichinella zimbabwensis]